MHAEGSAPATHEARCYCGGVTLAVTLTPADLSAVCSCGDCCSRAGSPVVWVVYAELKRVEVRDKDVLLRRAPTKKVAFAYATCFERWLCSRCGTHMYNRLALRGGAGMLMGVFPPTFTGGGPAVQPPKLQYHPRQVWPGFSLPVPCAEAAALDDVPSVSAERPTPLIVMRYGCRVGITPPFQLKAACPPVATVVMCRPVWRAPRRPPWNLSCATAPTAGAPLPDPVSGPCTWTPHT